jgi:hypothetical protein
MPSSGRASKARHDFKRLHSKLKPGSTRENCRASLGWAGEGTRHYVVSDRLIQRLGIIDHHPPLLVHAIEMMNRASAVTQRMGVGDRG